MNSLQTWTSSDGKTIVAKFVLLEDNAVVIEKDGKPFTIPFAKLSPSSIDLAKKLSESTLFEETTTVDPSIQFRWLQTDPKIADSIVDLIKNKNLSTSAFNAKISPQIKGGKINEVAAFSRDLVSGEHFVLKPADSKLPLMMEAETAVSEDRNLVDLRCVSKWEPKTPQGSGLLFSNGGITFSHKHWHLVTRWDDAKTATLLLTRYGKKSTIPEEPHAKWAINGTIVIVHLDVEWRECSAADVTKVLQAQQENRDKALASLRDQSTLLAFATDTCKSGRRSHYKYLWGGESDAKLTEESRKNIDSSHHNSLPRPGVTLRWDPTILVSKTPIPPLSSSAPIEENVAKANEYILGQELDLRLNATYVPLKSQGKSQRAEFVFSGVLHSGFPELLFAKEAPQQGQPVVLLIVTPSYEIIR